MRIGIKTGDDVSESLDRWGVVGLYVNTFKYEKKEIREQNRQQNRRERRKEFNK